MSEQTIKYKQTVVFCVLGESVTHTFLRGWTEVVGYCLMNNIKPVLSTRGINNFVMKTHSLVTSGSSNIPFDGNLEYDKIIFVSNKALFDVKAIATLINCEDNIVSAISSNKGGLEHTNYIENINNSGCDGPQKFEFSTIDSANKLLKEAQTNNTTTSLRVDYVDFTLVAIKKGILEKMPFPWFNYDEKTNDVTGDVYFCDKCKECGVDILVDLAVFVSTEKNVVY
jgi:hypothetical protein